jgi:hypothetical protein
LQKQLHLQKGNLVIVEEHGDGILLKQAIALPIENYSAKRKAEFLLSNVVDSADYVAARKAVKALGFDPDKIPHYKLTIRRRLRSIRWTDCFWTQMFYFLQLIYKFRAKLIEFRETAK